MSGLLASAANPPHVDFKGLSPLIALVGGSCIVLMVGLIRGRTAQRTLVPLVAAAMLLTAMGLTLWLRDPGAKKPIISGALNVDALALVLSMVFYIAGLATILLSLRSDVVRQAGG